MEVRDGLEVRTRRRRWDRLDGEGLGHADLDDTLCRDEDELGAVSVMLWYQQIQWIGDLADYAEKVANRLRLIIAN